MVETVWDFHLLRNSFCTFISSSFMTSHKRGNVKLKKLKNNFTWELICVSFGFSAVDLISTVVLNTSTTFSNCFPSSVITSLIAPDNDDTFSCVFNSLTYHKLVAFGGWMPSLSIHDSSCAAILLTPMITSLHRFKYVRTRDLLRRCRVWLDGSMEHVLCSYPPCIASKLIELVEEINEIDEFFDIGGTTTDDSSSKVLLNDDSSVVFRALFRIGLILNRNIKEIYH